LKFIKILFLLLICHPLMAQYSVKQSASYKKSYANIWAVGAKLRSDGLGVNVDITSGKKYRSALLYQFEFGYYKHPSQIKQSSKYGGGASDMQFKSFFFGKQNNLFAIHLNIGQKILIAEKAKKNGLRLYYHYAGGFSLGILKPYMLTVIDTNSLAYNPVTETYTFSETKDVAYNPKETYYLNYIYSNQYSTYFESIIGGAGFRKGWNLKFRPGLHFKTGLSFDWSKEEGMIKALELGVSCDVYFSKVPIMLVNNKSVFPSVYLGFQIGKRLKNK